MQAGSLSMTIKPFPNGPFEVNTYLVIEGNDALIIDPGAGILPLLGEIKKQGLSVCAFLITHPHIDHLDGIPHLRNLFPSVPGYIAEDALSEISKVSIQAKMFGVKDPGLFHIENTVKGEDIFQIGPFRIKPFATPGHCSGSLSFLIDGKLFSGDALFRETVGRTDLPGGSMSILRKYIEKKLFTLPDETIVFPGHGEETTIGHEKRYNPFFS